jgi:hypothetical protein
MASSRMIEILKPTTFSLPIAALVTLTCVTGCGKTTEPDAGGRVKQKLAASLHGTARGMQYWYDSAQGGFEGVAGLAYGELDCESCHVEPDDCAACHSDSEAPGTAGQDENCLGCHGFQGAEIAAGLSDCHRDIEGFECANCHDSNEAHGDGTVYQSLYQHGAMTTRCDNSGCHDSISSNEFHDNHAGANPIGDEMECAACHVRSVVTCYNCHFEYEVQGLGKLPFDHFKDWKFLLRRDRGDGEPKIDVGNLLTVTYQGKAFVAIGPYYAHTVEKNAVTDCGDCHNNEYVREYEDTGKIVVATWDESQRALVQNLKGKGIIPIPPSWETDLEFAFATYEEDGQGAGRWVKLEPTQVKMQMLFARPLEGLPK